MSKPNRGKAVKREEGWRGTCPLCNRQRVKLAWTKVTEDGQKLRVCKVCGNKK